MSNSYLDRKAKDTQANRHGRIGERKAMKAMGARQIPGSGSIPSLKSDGYTVDYRLENKTTLAQSFGLKLETLKKIETEARGYGQIPILTLSFVRGSGVTIDNGDYVIMRRVDFLELDEKAREGGK